MVFMGWKYLLLHRQALYLKKKTEIAVMDDDIEVRFAKNKVLVAASVAAKVSQGTFALIMIVLVVDNL